MRSLKTIAAAALLMPMLATPVMAQRYVRERVIVIDDDPSPYYDDGYRDGRENGYDDGRLNGYDQGYWDGRGDAPVVQVAQCKRRKGKGAVVGALAGGVLGRLTSDRNKLGNTVIGALGGGLLGDLIGGRGRGYDCD